MRLIDADALIQEWYRVNNINEDDRGARFIGYTEIPRFIANAPTVSADGVPGSWISRIDNDIWMLECSVCGCRVQEEKYRTAVGQSATKCPYCGAELGLGGYSYDEYADRPSQRGEDE